MPSDLECPSCWPWGELARGASDLDDLVCRKCHGRLCLQDATEKLLVQDVGLSIAELRKATQTLTEGKRRCPNCKKPMSLVRVKTTHVDLCFDCGASWYDAGEVGQVSGDRHAEPKPVPIPFGDDGWDMFQESQRRALAAQREGAMAVRVAVVGLLLAAAGLAMAVLR